MDINNPNNDNALGDKTDKLENYNDFLLVSNEDLPNATFQVEIEKTKEKGRFMVAAEEIQAGEIIAVEETAIYNVVHQKVSNTCYYCLKPAVAVFPCRCCRTVVYCSQACEEKCWNEIHKIECAFSVSLVQSGVFQMALRMLYFGMKENKNYFLKDKKKRAKVPNDPWGMNYKSISRGFADVGSLGEMHLKCFIYFSIAVSRMLAQIGELDPEEHDLRYVAETLFNHAVQSNLNGISMQRSKFDPKTNKLVDYEFLANGYFPTIALTNHGCAPNTVMMFKDRKCYLVTCRKIRAGEEISNNYGTLYSNDDKKTRKEYLNENYNFTCSCVACENDWSKLGRNQRMRFFRCPACFYPQNSPLSRADYQLCEVEDCQFRMDAQKNLQALGACVVRKALASEHLSAGRFHKAREEAVQAMKTLESYLAPNDFEIAGFKEEFITILEHNILNSNFL